MRWFPTPPLARSRVVHVATDHTFPAAPRARAVAGYIIAAVALVATACDTNDGKQLKSPEFPRPAVTIAEDADGSVDGSGDAADAEAALTPLTVPVDESESADDSGEFSLVASWPDGGPIDQRHTCDGDDISPALQWQNVPDAAVELALVVRDEDADGFLHWVVTGIDPSLSTIIENTAPAGATEWPNSFGGRGWSGPCPPPGANHLYQFEILALNQPTELADTTPASEVVTDLGQRTIAATAVTGNFTR